MSEPSSTDQVTDGGLLETPLTSWHREAGARLAEFAGYAMPIQYSSIVAEHEATRTAVGVFDISHMARLRFEGPRADELLDHLLTRRVTDMTIGQVRYSLMCNADGGILDDVLVSNLESPSGQEYFLLVVNAANHKKIVQWLPPHLADFPGVFCNDVTDATAMIAVQGPNASAVVDQLFSTPVSQMGYYRSRVTDQMNKPCIVSRTGYTGEDGYELIVRKEDAKQVWQNIMMAGRNYNVQPVGLAARDTLRLEAGMPLYGHELSDSIDPITAGLKFAVNLKDRQFIGSDALESKLEQQADLPKRIGLALEGRRAARADAKVLDSDGRVVGAVTSGTFSPTLGHPIAMAYVPPALAQAGTELEVDVRGSRLSARVVELPFYRRQK